MVSHDIPNIFRIADRVSIIHNGKMESGVDAKDYKESKNPWNTQCYEQERLMGEKE